MEETNISSVLDFSSAAKGAAAIANGDVKPKNTRQAKARPVFRPEYGYANRSTRHKYTDLKNQDKLTKGDIEDGITPLTKWFNRIAENNRMGRLRHESFLNNVVHNAYAEENAMRDRMRQSFIERFGEKTGNEMYNETIRLQIEEADRKIMRG